MLHIHLYCDEILGLAPFLSSTLKGKYTFSGSGKYADILQLRPSQIISKFCNIAPVPMHPSPAYFEFLQQCLHENAPCVTHTAEFPDLLNALKNDTPSLLHSFSLTEERLSEIKKQTSPVTTKEQWSRAVLLFGSPVSTNRKSIALAEFQQQKKDTRQAWFNNETKTLFCPFHLQHKNLQQLAEIRSAELIVALDATSDVRETLMAQQKTLLITRSR